nr:DEAD/DEAH box helicase [Roseomonas mucosa]
MSHAHSLRPYQRAAIDALYQWFGENSGNPLVVIPTAGGKSLVISTFIKEAVESYPDTRILVLTHVRELISQNYQELIGFWPDAPAGVYSAGLGARDLRSQIIFAGIQSIHRHAYALQRVDLVLVDEAHLIPRSSNTLYRKFLGQLAEINPYIKIVGFTATPFRLDSGMLHKGEDAMFSDIAYEVNILDLIREGYLTRPVSKSAVSQIDTSHVGTRGGEFIAGQLEAAATHPEVVAAVADEIVAAGQDRRGWIVFGCGVKHCEMLRDAIRSRGISCESIFGDTPAFERDRIIADFKAQKIRALSSMNVLTTGFNARHVDLVALARPTKSTGLYIQIVGRGTRLFPGKEDCLVLDFGGNIERHGPLDRPKAKKEKKAGGVREGMPVKVCPHCEAKNDIRARECADCGAAFPEVIQAISTSATTLGLLSVDQARPKWVPVSNVSYRSHQKPGKPTSLRVTYTCGLVQHSEWVCLEHTGYARERAVQWWRKRAPDVPVPNTVAEALAQSHALKWPRQIAVRPEGKFTAIVGSIL